jgi:hypothetical protein
MIEFFNKYQGTAIICKNKFYTYVELDSRIKFYKDILSKYSNKVIGILAEFDFESISLLGGSK